MAEGFVAQTLLYAPSEYARKTDVSMHGFTPYVQEYPRDVGYVISDRRFSVFLWNGTASDAIITEVYSENVGGMTIIGVEEGSTIETRSFDQIIVEVTKYGPIEFGALFSILSGCATVPSISIDGTRPLFATDQPIPITLNEAMAEAYADQSSGETYFDTLEFIELSSGDSVKVVHSDEDLETPQGTFTACKFSCKHPETEGGIVGSMQITVDFLPLAAQKWIAEKSRTGTGVTVYWRQYLGPNIEPDAYYPLPLDITSVEQSWTGATITASFPLLTAMKFPRRLMTTTVLPGGIT